MVTGLCEDVVGACEEVETLCVELEILPVDVECFVLELERLVEWLDDRELALDVREALLLLWLLLVLPGADTDAEEVETLDVVPGADEVLVDDVEALELVPVVDAVDEETLADDVEADDELCVAETETVLLVTLSVAEAETVLLDVLSVAGTEAELVVADTVPELLEVVPDPPPTGGVVPSPGVEVFSQDVAPVMSLKPEMSLNSWHSEEVNVIATHSSLASQSAKQEATVATSRFFAEVAIFVPVYAWSQLTA